MATSRLGLLAATAALGSLLPLLLAWWQGCNIYNSSLLLPGSEEGGPEAAADAGATCLARWPQPPAQNDPASSGGGAWVVAMQTVNVGANPDAGAILPDSGTPLPPIGFDLDNDCTCCTERSMSTCITGGSCIGPSVVCDDDAGRDHIALNIFRVVPNASAAANTGMQTGQFSILLQVSGYNGALNDTNVTVALYVSNGLVGIQNGGSVTPHHDGTDMWTVDSHYIATAQTGGTVPDGTPCNGTSACQPIYVDNSAWVTNGVLVARPEATLPLTFGYRANIGGALMKLNDTVISGTLRPIEVDGGPRVWGIVNGSISGRWESAQLLSNLATLPNPDVDGSYLCGTDPQLGALYQSAKTYICSLQDIVSIQALDNTMSTCDSLSMSLGFTAEPAMLGTVYTVDPPSSGCVSEAGLWSDKCQ